MMKKEEEEEEKEKAEKVEEKKMKKKTVTTRPKAKKKTIFEDEDWEDDDILQNVVSSEEVSDKDMDVFVSQLKSVFQVLDKDGSGEVSEKDLKRTVKKLIGRTPSIESPIASPSSSSSSSSSSSLLRSRSSRHGKYSRHQNKAITETMRHRRPTNFAKNVFSRADQDYSRSIDFVEFTEFFTILLHAIFSSIDLHDENQFGQDKFREFVVAVFGEAVFLKPHELKYSKSAHDRILEHRVKKAMLKANGGRLPCDKLSRKQCIHFVFNTHKHTTNTVFNALSHEATENAIQWKLARGLGYGDIQRVMERARKLIEN